jgi:tRNA dimethylallyltransferase
MTTSTPQQPPSVLAVIGPTATGKTLLGAKLAKTLHSEVISVDSQLIYEELAIGVARPTEAEMLGVPHHLIGVLPPIAEFSAGDYVTLARPILDRLLAEQKVPLLVGGTGFYLRALLQPAHLPKAPINPDLRSQFNQRVLDEGPQALYETLRGLDPQRAKELHPNDTARVMRALEIIDFTEKPIPITPTFSQYPLTIVGLTYADRERHLQVIADRLQKMIQAGFLAEVEALYSRYGNCQALQKAHGYPELVDVLEGKRSLESAMAQININIRQYSKRQMTWFRKVPGIQWYFVDEQSIDEVMTSVIHQFV